MNDTRDVEADLAIARVVPASILGHIVEMEGIAAAAAGATSSRRQLMDEFMDWYASPSTFKNVCQDLIANITAFKALITHSYSLITRLVVVEPMRLLSGACNILTRAVERGGESIVLEATEHSRLHLVVIMIRRLINITVPPRNSSSPCIIHHRIR